MKLKSTKVLIVLYFIVFSSLLGQNISLNQNRLIELGRVLYHDFINRDSLKIKYGLPIKIETSEVKNIHTDDIDEYLRYYYPDFELIFYHNISRNRFFMSVLILKDSVIFKKYNIAYNSEPFEVETIYGSPSSIEKKNNDILIYKYDLNAVEAEDSFSFHFKNGKLIKFYYMPYLD